MNTFTRKALYAAIAGVAAIGVASTAKAVNISADGLGQVLIYPYYTVRNNASGLAFNTLMSVVNTTASVKAIKVRFREGRNSVEVLDFNVFLSPFDVWTASITPTADGGGQISTTDKSCTIPTFTSGVPVPFRTISITDADNAASRTGEGYFEVFEMATETGVTATKATHVSGVPPCGITDAGALADQAPPTGGLFGGVIIVNPAGGGAFSQPATALANFNPTASYQTTGSLSPQYADAVPLSNVIQGGTLYSSVWNNGNDAVTAVLLGNAVTNEYNLETGTKSQTSWIITMPTKYAYVNGAGAPFAPFTHTYVSGTGACEPTFAVVFNREEASPQIVTTNDFSPQTPGAPGPTICFEATSVNFNGGNVFGSTNFKNLSTAFTSGWATFGFNDPLAPAVHQMAPTGGSTISFDLSSGNTSFAQVTYYGLPVVGFAAETFQNDAIIVGGKSFLATFGAEFVHHKTTKIQ
jgi:hypothetical protein